MSVAPDELEEHAYVEYKHTDTVDAESLARRQRHHLATESEEVAIFSVTHDSSTWRTDCFDPKIVELELVILLVVALARRHDVLLYV